jgi:hypothetical protein
VVAFALPPTGILRDVIAACSQLGGVPNHAVMVSTLPERAGPVPQCIDAPGCQSFERTNDSTKRDRVISRHAHDEVHVVGHDDVPVYGDRREPPHNDAQGADGEFTGLREAYSSISHNTQYIAAAADDDGDEVTAPASVKVPRVP